MSVSGSQSMLPLQAASHHLGIHYLGGYLLITEILTKWESEPKVSAPLRTNPYLPYFQAPGASPLHLPTTASSCHQIFHSPCCQNPGEKNWHVTSQNFIDHAGTSLFRCQQEIFMLWQCLFPFRISFKTRAPATHGGLITVFSIEKPSFCLNEPKGSFMYQS